MLSYILECTAHHVPICPLGVCTRIAHAVNVYDYATRRMCAALTNVFYVSGYELAVNIMPGHGEVGDHKNGPGPTHHGCPWVL